MCSGEAEGLPSHHLDGCFHHIRQKRELESHRVADVRNRWDPAVQMIGNHRGILPVTHKTVYSYLPCDLEKSKHTGKVVQVGNG